MLRRLFAMGLLVLRLSTILEHCNRLPQNRPKDPSLAPGRRRSQLRRYEHRYLPRRMTNSSRQVKLRVLTGDPGSAITLLTIIPKSIRSWDASSSQGSAHAGGTSCSNNCSPVSRSLKLTAHLLVPGPRAGDNLSIAPNRRFHSSSQVNEALESLFATGGRKNITAPIFSSRLTTYEFISFPVTEPAIANHISE